jgi:hypothetical protein
MDYAINQIDTTGTILLTQWKIQLSSRAIHPLLGKAYMYL